MAPTWEVRSPSAEDTRNLGRALGRWLRPGHLELLDGTLGAAKPVFVQGVAEGMGIGEPVTSPTFTLVHHYGYGTGGSGQPAGGGAGSAPSPALVHADLYRLAQAEEVEHLGLEDAAEAGPLVVEWWSRAADYFPPGRLEVDFQVEQGNGRRLRVKATDAHHEALLRAWQQQLEREGRENSRP